MRDFEDLKVLLVCANAFDRGVLLTLLREVGVERVLLADDAVSAFAQLSIRPIDALLIDAETCQRALDLVAEVRTSDTPSRRRPILVASGERSIAFAEAAEEAGVSDILSKPASVAELRRALLAGMAAGANSRGLTERFATRVHGPRTPELPRVDFTAPDPIGRQKRLAMSDHARQAREALSRFGQTGAEADLEAGRHALTLLANVAPGTDAVIDRIVTVTRRLLEGPAPDVRLADACLAGLRHVLLDTGRPALNQAFAQVLTAAARRKSVLR